MEHVIGNIYRELKEGKNNRYYNYFLYRQCDNCKKWYYAKKSGDKVTAFCSNLCAGVRRGRPIGTRLNSETRDRIAKARKGKKHREETKTSISKSLSRIDHSLLPPKRIYRVTKEHKMLRNRWRYERFYHLMCNDWLDFKVFKQWVMDHGWTTELVVCRIDTEKLFSPDNTIMLTKAEHCIKLMGKEK
jgi:hypothetical protein